MTDPLVRIADALERIARALEQQIYGVTADDLKLAVAQALRERDPEDRT
jgi:hypothetical protein